MEENTEFLMLVKEHFEAIAELIREFEMEDKVIAASVIGVLDPIDEDHSDMTAIYAMNIEDRKELEVIIDFLNDAWDENNPDIDGLIKGLGISLN